jgi:hypothetical protein
VVHAVLDEDVQGLVGHSLRDTRERGGTEDHPGADVAGAAKFGGLDRHHGLPFVPGQHVRRRSSDGFAGGERLHYWVFGVRGRPG